VLNEINEINDKKMYCGLIIGNCIVAVGRSTPSPGARLNRGFSHPHSSQLQSLSRHAEMDILRYFRKHTNAQKKKARLVVLRYTTSTGNFGNSRPCLHCIRRILRYHRNIVNVTFFENGQWYSERPDEIVLHSGLSSGDRRMVEFE